jgi:ADP-heptose:LPS heptosyltransferase
MTISDQDCKKVVILRLGSMGDTIVALPCFHAVRRSFPNAHITLLTNVPVSAKAAPMMLVLGSNGSFVNDFLNYNIGLTNPLEALMLLLRLRSIGAKTLVFMRSKPSVKVLTRDSFFFRLAGFHSILCLPLNEDQRVSRIDSQTNELEAEASRLARCFEPLGLIDLHDPRSWDLLLSDAEKQEGKRLTAQVPAPFLAINMGGKVPQKDWGFDRWAQLLIRLREQTGASGIVILGAQNDQQRSHAILDIWGDGSLSLCGETSPRQAAAVLAHARLFIGHDSGPLHLAQCMGTPALGLFGSYNKPVQWHPIGSHVSVIHNQRGIEVISVDEVLHRAVAMWNKL